MIDTATYEYDFYEDVCYECTGYGDDYFINDDGEFESFCPYCLFNDDLTPEDE